MDNFKEKNDDERNDLQISGQDSTEERRSKGSTGKRRSTSPRTTNQEKSKEVSDALTNGDLNGGTIGAQDLNTNNMSGGFAGLWESRKIQIDSSNITNRAQNIVNAKKSRGRKTASGQVMDTVSINPNLELKPNYNPTSVNTGF